jgi:hypothetical protein
MAFDVHHGGHSGDIVYSIPYMRSLAEHFGDYLRVNIISDRPSPLPAAMRHPSGASLMSKAAFEFLEPMLAYQDIIDSVRLLSLNQVPGGSVPLDFFRETRGLNVRSGNIPLWARKISGLEVSVEKPWINLPPVKKGHRLLLGFSVRYRNSAIDYSVLNQIQGVQIAFVGLPNEYEDFTKRHRLHNIDHLQVENALELGKVIKSSRFFLGNQSLAFSIAEALKVDRALEVCEICPNVVPIGGKAHEYVFQAAFANALNKNGFPTSPTNRRDIAPVLALDALD